MTKIVTKNGYKFASGMFWQIPDEGKRALNLSKLIKDTRHNMFCQIRSIKPTWGFCRRDDLHGEKKVASLGKFIIDTSKLSANYANSIICYKFKNAGEIDDDGKALNQDLYGYIVLLNGTICPDEGEYVAEFAAVRESIIEKASRHEVEALYLPSDVAAKFFSIFEILVEAYANEALLIHLMQNLSVQQRADLDKLILDEFGQSAYISLTQSVFDSTNISLLQRLILEPVFEHKHKGLKERQLKFIINNIYTLNFTSDDVYWNNPKFKANYKQALVKPISRDSNQKVKLLLLLCLLIFTIYLSYSTFFVQEQIVEQSIVQAPPPVAQAVNPQLLIDKCLAANDRFFKDLGVWTLVSLKCNSLGASLTFNSEREMTLTDFTHLVNDARNTTQSGKSAIYSPKYQILNKGIINKNHLATDQITSQLQQAAINYNYTLTLSTPIDNVHKFSISSLLSPVFLLKHGVLDNVLIREINMSFNQNDGFYTWTVEGEYK